MLPFGVARAQAEENLRAWAQSRWFAPNAFKRQGAEVNTEWATRGTAGTPSFTGDQGDLWDAGVWDTAIWSDADAAFFAWLGADGLGSYCSLRMSVIALPGTIFTSWKLIYIPGGSM